MDADSVLHYLHGLHWESLVKLIGSLIETHQHDLVEPVRSSHCNETNWVQNWEAQGIHKADADTNEHLGKLFSGLNLGSSVQLLEVTLAELLGVWPVIIIFKLILFHIIL